MISLKTRNSDVRSLEIRIIDMLSLKTRSSDVRSLETRNSDIGSLWKQRYRIAVYVCWVEDTCLIVWVYKASLNNRILRVQLGRGCRGASFRGLGLPAMDRPSAAATEIASRMTDADKQIVRSVERNTVLLDQAPGANMADQCKCQKAWRFNHFHS